MVAMKSKDKWLHDHLIKSWCNQITAGCSLSVQAASLLPREVWFPLSPRLDMALTERYVIPGPHWMAMMTLSQNQAATEAEP